MKLLRKDLEDALKRQWRGKNERLDNKKRAEQAIRTGKYARRSVPKVDPMVPGQHLLEDVLVGVFSNRNRVDPIRVR